MDSIVCVVTCRNKELGIEDRWIEVIKVLRGDRVHVVDEHLGVDLAIRIAKVASVVPDDDEVTRVLPGL